MNDCTNAEMRDQLPDLLHERLDASARAVVLAHVEGCVDCRDELQLLRDVRGVFDRATPRVDVSYVVGALPLPPARVVPASRRRHVWADWRVAAAVMLLAVGGTSVAVLRSDSNSSVSPAIGDERVAATPVPTVPAPVATIEKPATTAEREVAATPTPTPTSETSPDSRFNGLDEQQLKALLGEIEKLQAVPVAEPEPVMIRVSGTSSSEGV